jgi:hypothetical protein
VAGRKQANKAGNYTTQVPQEMVIVNVKISVDENYTTQEVIQIKIYITNASRTKSGWKF